MNFATLLTLAIVLLRACSTDGAATPFADGGASADMLPGTPPADEDALYADPSRAADRGEFESPEPGVGGDDGAVASCFDGDDSDGDDLVDCADPDCASSVRSCCAGRGDCCAAPGTTSLFESPADLSSCASDPAGCLDATGFGTPSAYIADGLSGGGDGRYDSGVLFSEVVRLDAERVAVRAELGLPADCAAGCMESVSFGFTRQTELDAQSHVRPVLALTLSPSRGEVSLLAGDRVLGAWPAEAGVWGIVAAPTGDVGVERPTGSESVDGGFSPPNEARLAVWGHNANPSATADAGARVRSLAVERALCDMPRAWRPEAPLRDGSGGELVVPGPPSIAAWGDGAALAFATESGIAIATRSAGDGGWTEAGLIERGEVRFTDPELVALDGELVVFATLETDEGAALGRFGGTPESGYGGPFIVLHPGDLSADAIRGATVAVRQGSPSLVMIAEVEGPDGDVLTRFTSADGGQNWLRRGPLSLPALDDTEAIGATSLSVHDGVYLLYVALRRGTRWRIAHLASDDFVHWRLVDDEAIGSSQLAPLGARAPDAMATTTGVEMVFLGHDGVSPKPLSTWRPATDEALLPTF